MKYPIAENHVAYIVRDLEYLFRVTGDYSKIR